MSVTSITINTGLPFLPMYRRGPCHYSKNVLHIWVGWPDAWAYLPSHNDNEPEGDSYA